MFCIVSVEGCFNVKLLHDLAFCYYHTDVYFDYFEILRTPVKVY